MPVYLESFIILSLIILHKVRIIHHKKRMEKHVGWSGITLLLLICYPHSLCFDTNSSEFTTYLVVDASTAMNLTLILGAHHVPKLEIHNTFS